MASVIASGVKQSIKLHRQYGLLRRGACHHCASAFRATRWLPCANASRLSQAMTT
jgi:hypothetical protein